MPAQEVVQPETHMMEVPVASAEQQQPRPVEQMSAEPLSMRGGGEGDVCCGICAGLACFECLECCC